MTENSLLPLIDSLSESLSKLLFSSINDSRSYLESWVSRYSYRAEKVRQLSERLLLSANLGRHSVTYSLKSSGFLMEAAKLSLSWMELRYCSMINCMAPLARSLNFYSSISMAAILNRATLLMSWNMVRWLSPILLKIWSLEM